MSYQVLGFVYLGAAVAGFVVLGITFGTFVKLAEQLIAHFKTKRQEAKDKEANLQSAEVPEQEPTLQPVAVTPPSEDAPVIVKGVWYANASIAGKFHNLPVEAIKEQCAYTQNGKDLWDEDGHFDVAVRHRCSVVDGRKRIRLCVSDYKVSERSEHRFSRGFLVHGHGRKRIDVEDQVTNHNTISFFQQAAKEALHAGTA